MTSLVEEFMQQIGVNFYFDDEDDIDFTIDLSKFNIIDGEEGDYGTKEYFVCNKLIATEEVYGGDDYNVEFTEIGSELLKNKVRYIFEKKLNSIKG